MIISWIKNSLQSRTKNHQNLQCALVLHCTVGMLDYHDGEFIDYQPTQPSHTAFFYCRRLSVLPGWESRYYGNGDFGRSTQSFQVLCGFLSLICCSFKVVCKTFFPCSMIFFSTIYHILFNSILFKLELFQCATTFYLV